MSGDRSRLLEGWRVCLLGRPQGRSGLGGRNRLERRQDTLGQWVHELDLSQRHGQRVISAREILIMIVWTGSLGSVLRGLLRDRAG